MIPSEELLLRKPLIPDPILPSITSPHPWFIRNFPALKSDLALVQFVSKIPPRNGRDSFPAIKAGTFPEGNSYTVVINHCYIFNVFFWVYTSYAIKVQ